MSETAMRINMESALMLPLRTDMDGIINRTLKTMHSTGNGEAVVTAKIKITLAKRAMPTKDGVRPSIQPKFEHEVQSVVQAKDKKTGSMTGDYELVYDPDTDEWVARDRNAQTSMFDKKPADAQGDDVKGLPPATIHLGDGSEAEDDGDLTDDEEIEAEDVVEDDEEGQADEGEDEEPEDDGEEE